MIIFVSSHTISCGNSLELEVPWLLMLRLLLPWAPYNNLSAMISTVFRHLGELRAMAFVFTFYTAVMQFL